MENREPEYVWHYTSIDTLGLIVQNQTIRFNRLDKVDDASEGLSFERLRLEKFFLVSSWTHQRDERIHQWDRYGDRGAGVRLCFPRRMFEYKPLYPPPELEMTVQGVTESPLPFRQVFGPDYLVLPTFLKDEHFARRVEYLSNFVAEKNSAIRINQDANRGTIEVSISHPTRIACLTSPDWAHQEEYRFVIFVVPAPVYRTDATYVQSLSRDLPNIAIDALVRGNQPSIDHLDIRLSPKVLSSIDITVGPLCDNDGLTRVTSLLRDLPGATVSKSRLTGTLRR
jgi:hypothetical protein